jgi:hypothetical protein
MSGSDRHDSRPDEDGDWFTISYRSIYLSIGILLLIVAGGLYLRFGRSADSPPPAPAAAVPTTARFSAIVGNVKVKAVGTFEWVGAERQTALRKSDLVRTGPGSTAEITFFDGSIVHVRPDSLITIEETLEDPATKRRRVAWHVSSGEVNLQTFRHGAPGAAAEVSTPTVKGTVAEMTTASIRVAEAGDSSFRLFQGSGRVETRTGQSVQLAANEALTVDAAGKAGEKVTLPEAPAPLTPGDGEVLAYRDPASGRTRLTWKPVAAARGYRLMLDIDSSFNRPLVDRRGIPQTAQELRGLDEGRYFWRVAALDAAGNESAFSALGRFNVTRATAGRTDAGPPLEIGMLDVRANIVQIKGRTEPGATVTVNGQRIDVQPDGSFNEFLSLGRLGRQTLLVRAVGLNGAVAEQRRTVEASY